MDKDLKLSRDIVKHMYKELTNLEPTIQIKNDKLKYVLSAFWMKDKKDLGNLYKSIIHTCGLGLNDPIDVIGNALDINETPYEQLPLEVIFMEGVLRGFELSSLYHSTKSSDN